MEQLISLLALVGMGVAAVYGVKFMARAGRINSARSNPLSPSDLKLLEETTSRLMADLRATADECVARIDAACERAEGVIAARGAVGSAVTATAPIPVRVLDTNESPIVHAARQTGLPTGELELMRSLQSMTALRTDAEG